MTPAKTRSGNPSGRRSESGTAAIEFGLFIPFLLILFTGTVELGFAMYESMQVNNAVEAGMLYAAKNGWDSTGITNAVINASSVYAGGGPSLTATPAPSQFCGCPQATGITVMTCGPPLPTCADGTTVGQYVQVNAALNHLTILPLSGLVLPTTLTATAVLRVN
jgi:Flp pilus assembly protein TadG